MTRRTATAYRAEYWHDTHTDPSNPGWVLRITRDGETIYEGEALYVAEDERDPHEVRDAIAREVVTSYGRVNPRPVQDPRPGVEAFEWTAPPRCPACTMPIPDDERATVQFEGAPDEVWHRDCLERELREFHGGAPKVMGLGEIAEAFGVTLRTASRWADRPDFPSPLPGSVSGRPAWDRETVMAWEPPDPRGGRPPR